MTPWPFSANGSARLVRPSTAACGGARPVSGSATKVQPRTSRWLGETMLSSHRPPLNRSSTSSPSTSHLQPSTRRRRHKVPPSSERPQRRWTSFNPVAATTLSPRPSRSDRQGSWPRWKQASSVDAAGRRSLRESSGAQSRQRMGPSTSSVTQTSLSLARSRTGCSWRRIRSASSRHSPLRRMPSVRNEDTSTFAANTR